MLGFSYLVKECSIQELQSKGPTDQSLWGFCIGLKKRLTDKAWCQNTYI